MSLGHLVREALGEYLARAGGVHPPAEAIDAVLLAVPFDDLDPDPELSLNVDHYLYGSMSAMVTARGRALTRRGVRPRVGARLRAGGDAPGRTRLGGGMAMATMTIERVVTFNGLDVLVARDEGLFAAEGLDLRIAALPPSEIRSSAEGTLEKPVTNQGVLQGRGEAVLFQG